MSTTLIVDLTLCNKTDISCRHTSSCKLLNHCLYVYVGIKPSYYLSHYSVILPSSPSSPFIRIPPTSRIFEYIIIIMGAVYNRTESEIKGERFGRKKDV
jgi:hypothetical protein